MIGAEREAYLSFSLFCFENEEMNIVDLMNNLAYGGDPI